MYFDIKSRREAESFNIASSPHVIISIYTPGDEPPLVKQNRFTKDVLTLGFDDLDRQPSTATLLALGGRAVLFNEEYAREILRFVNKWKDQIDLITCHCDAGISRSSGTAAALSRILNGMDEPFFKPPYVPNRLVYRTILQTQFDENILR